MQKRLQRDIMKFIGVDRSQTLVADRNRAVFETKNKNIFLSRLETFKSFLS